MLYRALTDATLLLHFAFILFVVFGGFLVRRKSAWAFAHLPSVVWVACVEYTRTICPLTAIEKTLRSRAGMNGYEGGFVAHYLLPVIHPPSLTSQIQITLSLIVVTFNIGVYARLSRRARHGSE